MALISSFKMNTSIYLNTIDRNKFKISISLIWLFNFLAIVLIPLGYEEWFLKCVPIGLLGILFLILWNANFKKEILISLAIPFVLGIFSEFIGVHYGFIFGNYSYGNSLGIKVLDIPLSIGISWAILVYSTASISKLISNNFFLSAVAGAVLMTSLDMLVEVSASRFDFWSFDQGFAPIQNYIGWFFVSLIAHLIFQKVLKSDHFLLSFHIFTALTLFFSIFILF